MTEEQVRDVGLVEDDPEIDPVMAEAAMQQFLSEQNFMGAVVAGLIAAIVGAVVWAAITVITGYQIGWMAVGVGFIVGITIRTVGKGMDKQFGIAGAVIALVGCLLGNIFSISYFVAKGENMGIFGVLSRLNPKVAADLLVATFSPIDLLFYGIALYEGYRLSIRHITEEELVRAVKGTGGIKEQA